MRDDSKAEARAAIKVDLERFDGWCGCEKATKLFDTIIDLNPSLIVEVGVYGGRSLVVMATAALYLDHSCKVFGFDTWDVNHSLEHLMPLESASDREAKEYWVTQNPRAIYDEMMRRLSDHEMMAEVIPVCEESANASGLFLNDSIDMLHLDANHSEWASTRDVLLWVPKVRSGGIVCLDDTNFDSLPTAIRFTLQYCDEVYSPEDKQYTIYRKR
jgi:predicted O-methyltransferase YrrM|tara:strand:- start:7025 stop:7669 length:645 start_codon:yes stop_codon:yes gene_type:complete